MTSSRIYFFIFFWLLLQQNITAQEWIRQHPFPVINNLLDIVVDENGNGWAVGIDKTVLRTYNFGEVWNDRTIQDDSWVFVVNKDLIQAFLLPDTNGEGALVATTSFNLLRTVDDGDSWEVVLEGRNINERFQTLATIGNSTTIAAVGKDLYTSADQGSSWDTIALPSVQYVKKGFFLDEQNWWLVDFTVAGELFKTTDGGQSWTQPASQTFAFVRAIHFFNQQEGILVDNNGFYETSDGGDSWTLASAITAVTDLCVQNEDELFASRSGGIAYSTDGGNNWTEAFFGYGAFQACASLPDGRRWMVGEYSSVYHATDNINWADQVGGVKAALQEILFTDENTGFARDADGRLLHTSDGGAIWEDISSQLPATESTFSTSYADVSGKIILLDAFGRVMLSEDYGTSWQIADSIGFGSYNQMVAAEGGALFLTSETGYLWTSTNGGYDWASLGQIGPSIEDIHFNTATSGWACGNDGQFYHTTDAGLSWETVDLNTAKNLKEVEFVNELKGFVVPRYIVAGDVLWFTEDGGQSWETAPAPPIAYVNDVKFSDENHGWIAGGVASYGQIYATTDGGETWTLTHDNGPEILNSIACPVPGEVAWAAGPGGQILKWVTCETANDPPLLTQIAADTALFCSGDTISLTLSFSNVDLFQWSLPSDWILLSNENSASVEVIVGVEDGVITAIGQNACGEEDSVSSELLEPLSAPNPPTLVFDNGLLQAQGDTDTYRWFLNGMEIPDESNPALAPNQNGIYTVEAVNPNGCTSGPSNAVEVTNVSVFSLSANAKLLHIAPNPAEGHFSLSHLPKGKQATLLLYDAYGKTVLKHKFLTNGSALLVEWQDYQPGLYYLRLEMAGQVYAGKVVFR